MNPMSDDTDLRARFRQLRNEVNSSAPPFVVKPAAQIKRPPVGWALGTVGATIALALLIWTAVSHSGQPAESSIDLSRVAWTAPSDYLLDTPGMELLRSLPEIDINKIAQVPFDQSSGTADTSS